jgi:hypothetical protein
MINLYLWTFVGLMIVPLLLLMLKPARVYEYPYFMTATFAMFILPQAVSLIRFPGAAPAHAVQSLLMMTCLCLGACLVGYKLSISRHVIERVSGGVNEQRLFHVGLVFVACGYGFTYLLSHIEIQHSSETGGWTGTATIFSFFQQLCYPGFAICLMSALRRSNLTTIVSLLVAAVVPIQTVLGGRREPAALFLVTMGLTLYFSRRLQPPRWMVLGIITGAMLAIPATATYRGLHARSDWDGIRQMDLVGNFKEFVNDESILELRNAAILIEATDRSGDYEYGAGYWNTLVARYVPAQILGTSFKQSLLIQGSRGGQEIEFATMSYSKPVGTTVTGMGDSFQQFGYWGCFFFVALAVLFRSLWQAALQPNAIFAQLLYMQSCTSAMRAVTHQTVDFPPGFVYNLIFLGAAMLYARQAAAPGWLHRVTRRADAVRKLEHAPSVNPPLTPPRRGTRQARTDNRRFPSRGPSAPVAALPLPSPSAAHPPDGTSEPREGGTAESS